MAETRYPVQVYRVDYRCDQCGTPVQRTGVAPKLAHLLALPLHDAQGRLGRGTMYQHRCQGCDAVVWLAREYPRNEYEPMRELA